MTTRPLADLGIDYGASVHYQGSRGMRYYSKQSVNAAIGAQINASKFAAHVAPADRVLDFGCGGGWLLAALLCSERVGVEVNLSAHDACRSNAITVYRSIREVKERDFDVAISHHCLEHVPYPIEALRGIRDLLRDGGKLVLVVPMDDWRVQRRHSSTDIDNHLHTWTPLLLGNTLKEAGYVVCGINVYTHAWFPGWASCWNRIPRGAFDISCRFWAIFRKRRQLIATAMKTCS